MGKCTNRSEVLIVINELNNENYLLNKTLKCQQNLFFLIIGKRK